MVACGPLVGIDGARSFVGGNARFIIGRWVGGMTVARFPLGTFLINVGGSFLLGFLAGLLATRALPTHSRAGARGALP